MEHSTKLRVAGCAPIYSSRHFFVVSKKKKKELVTAARSQNLLFIKILTSSYKHLVFIHDSRNSYKSQEPHAVRQTC